MEITEVRIKLVAGEAGSKLRAFASITIDGAFVVHDLKVIQGVKGLFLAMPSRKTGDGEFRDICHPIDQATRDRLTRVVLEAYRRQADGHGRAVAAAGALNLAADP